jgi:hypothetical protein
LPPVGQKIQPPAATITSSQTYLNVNAMLIFVMNQGNYAYDAGKLFGRNDGCYYPYTSVADILSGANDKHDIFDAGIWVGAIDSASGETRVTVAEYSTEFTPGPMVGTYFDTSSLSNPLYRTYKLYSDSMASNSNADYTFLDEDAVGMTIPCPRDSAGHPTILGDQQVWSVYNDADTAQHSNQAGASKPLGLEIQQTSFAFALTGEMSNSTFHKYKIKNNGTSVLKDVYVALWADVDDGDAGDDLNGCDTILKLGYIYNGTNNDAIYGSKPPAVGTVFLQGPLEYTGNPSDIGIMWGGTQYPGYRNLPMSAYAKYINGTDPQSADQSYNYMRGLQRDGSPYTFNGQVVKFQVSGDPVANTGDVDFSPSDRRMFQSTGPFTFRPGDSTEIAMGVVMGQGSDRLTSITAMKYYTTFAQKAYNENFVLPKPPRAPEITATGLTNRVSLVWNDTSEVDNGDYPFQGYTIYQGATAGGPWTRIGNYDINDGVGVIFQNQFDLASGVILYVPVRFGTDNGIKRFFSTSRDFLTGNELSNNTQYFYKVEAYSYDPAKLPPTLSSQTVVTVTPQSPTAGTQIRPFGDTLATTHIGISDGSVSPLIVMPDSLRNNTYQVTFTVYPDTIAAFYPETFDTSTFTHDSTFQWACHINLVTNETTFCEDTVVILDSLVVDTSAAEYDTTVVDTTFWRLTNLTTNQIMIDSQYVQTSDSTLPIFDGIQLNVSGPPAGLKSGSEGDPNEGWSIPRGTRRFTWSGGDFGFEAFNGALGWASPCYIFDGCPPGVPPGNIRNVLLKLAITDTLGNFDPADSNASYAYRYGRGFASPPAQPEFAPFIINAVGGYSFQDYTISVPLAAYDVEADPPRRLALGFLENNVPDGAVNGKYWPPLSGVLDNVDGAGPREWLWIFNTDYTDATPNPDFEVAADGNPLPVMYWATWARRQQVDWAGEDEFEMYRNKINLPSDTFTFAGIAPATTANAAALDNVRAVPNPYYLFSSYDTDVSHRQIRFTNLPVKCDITIYNLGGDKVGFVSKDSPESWTSWNLLTINGFPVASGIYVYVVNAPGYGTKVGKLAVFTEVEQLKTY